MRIILRISIFFLTLVSCTNISELKRVAPTGNQFQQYLAKEYIKFAESEASQYDWIDSEYFANKAMLALYGMATLPEDPTQWRISKSFLPEIIEARIQLMNLMTQENIKQNFEDLALAQFFYDSWIEQQEENWQISEIEKCKENFYIHISNINRINHQKFNAISENNTFDTKIKKYKKQKLSQHKNIKPLKLSENRINNHDLKIYFEQDNKNINKNSLEVLKNLIPYLQNHKKVEVVLNSYSSHLESDEKNLLLSKQRALIIKNKLLKSGISENNITVFAFGNSPIEVSNSFEHEKIILDVLDQVNK